MWVWTTYHGSRCSSGTPAAHRIQRHTSGTPAAHQRHTPSSGTPSSPVGAVLSSSSLDPEVKSMYVGRACATAAPLVPVLGVSPASAAASASVPSCEARCDLAPSTAAIVSSASNTSVSLTALPPVAGLVGRRCCAAARAIALVALVVASATTALLYVWTGSVAVTTRPCGPGRGVTPWQSAPGLRLMRMHETLHMHRAHRLDLSDYDMRLSIY